MEVKKAKAKCISTKALTYLSTPVIITLLINPTCLTIIMANKRYNNTITTDITFIASIIKSENTIV